MSCGKWFHVEPRFGAVCGGGQGNCPECEDERWDEFYTNYPEDFADPGLPSKYMRPIDYETWDGPRLRPDAPGEGPR